MDTDENNEWGILLKSHVDNKPEPNPQMPLCIQEHTHARALIATLPGCNSVDQLDRYHIFQSYLLTKYIDIGVLQFLLWTLAHLCRYKGSF